MRRWKKKNLLYHIPKNTTKINTFHYQEQEGLSEGWGERSEPSNLFGFGRYGAQHDEHCVNSWNSTRGTLQVNCVNTTNHYRVPAVIVKS